MQSDASNEISPENVRAAGAVDLSGRVALVTGGGTGLGRAISLALAAAGCDVAINYSRSADEAEATAAAVRALGRRACALRADVSDADAVEAAVSQATEALGTVTLVANVAGGSGPGFGFGPLVALPLQVGKHRLELCASIVDRTRH